MGATPPPRPVPRPKMTRGIVNFKTPDVEPPRPTSPPEPVYRQRAFVGKPVTLVAGPVSEDTPITREMFDRYIHRREELDSIRERASVGYRNEVLDSTPSITPTERMLDNQIDLMQAIVDKSYMGNGPAHKSVPIIKCDDPHEMAAIRTVAEWLCMSPEECFPNRVKEITL